MAQCSSVIFCAGPPMRCSCQEGTWNWKGMVKQQRLITLPSHSRNGGEVRGQLFRAIGNVQALAWSSGRSLSTSATGASGRVAASCRLRSLVMASSFSVSVRLGLSPRNRPLAACLLAQVFCLQVPANSRMMFA